MKSYLNPNDRFATRMKASMSRSKAQVNQVDIDQQNLFVDGADVNLTKEDGRSKYQQVLINFLSLRIFATSPQWLPYTTGPGTFNERRKKQVELLP